MGIPPTTKCGGLPAQTYRELPLAFARGFLLHRGDALHRRYGPSQPCKKKIYKKKHIIFGFHLIPSLS